MQGAIWLPEHAASAVKNVVQAPRASGTGIGFGAVMAEATRATATMMAAWKEYIVADWKVLDCLRKV